MKHVPFTNRMGRFSNKEIGKINGKIWLLKQQQHKNPANQTKL